MINLSKPEGPPMEGLPTKPLVWCLSACTLNAALETRLRTETLSRLPPQALMWLKKSRLFLFLLTVGTLLTAAYWIFRPRWLNICPNSCSLGAMLLYFTGSADPTPTIASRIFECANETQALMTALLGRQWSSRLSLSQPTYSRPKAPVTAESVLSPACASVFAISSHPASRGECFNMSYSPTDQADVYPVLHRVQQNFSQRGLEIFMSSGSLLGSARHFGFIPWDDDIDFMILRDQKPEVRELLVQLSSGDEFEFVDTELTNQHWRLGILCRGDASKPKQPRYNMDRLYPAKICRISVDFFFGWASGSSYRRLEKPFKFRLSDVYPLTLRPFGEFLLPAPHRSEAFLAVEYEPAYHSRCLFQIHSNRFHCPKKLLNCSRLRGLYAFTVRLKLRIPGSSGRLIDADVLASGSQLQAIYIPRQ